MGKDIDSLIKDVFEEEFENIKYPPSDEMWGQIRLKLRDERRKMLLKKLRPAFVTCTIIVALFGLLINFQMPVMSFINKIIKNVEEIAGNTLKIHREDVAQSEKSEVDVSRNIDDPRIGEAQKNIHFNLLIPEYIPKDFKLNNIDVLNKNKEKEVVTLRYINDENKQESFEITQESFPSSVEDTINILDDEDANVEHIKIIGMDCTFLHYDSTINKLIWINSHLGYKIDGRVSKDDIIKIVESMK